MNLMPRLLTTWNQLASREKTGVSLALGLLGLALLWWLLLAPALHTWRHSQSQREQLDKQLQSMQSMQTQARALQAQPQIGREDALRALQAAAKQGLGAGAQLSVNGERVSVSLKGISGPALAQWLTQSRINAHALPTEAQLSRDSADPSAWSGQVVMTLPAR